MKIISLSFFNDIYVHSYQEFIFYKNLNENYDVDIDVVNCDGFFSDACIAHGVKQISLDSDLSLKKKICEACKKTTRFYKDNSSHRTLNLSDYFSPENKKEIDEIIDGIKIENFQKLKVFGVEVGKVTLFNFLIMNKLNSLNLNTLQFEEYKIYLKNSLKALFSFKKLMDENKYDVFISYSIEYSYNKVCAEYAKLNGIKIYGIVAGQNPFNKYSKLYLMGDAHKLGFAYQTNKYFSKFKEIKIAKKDLNNIEGYINSLLNSKSYLNFSKSPEGIDIKKFFKIPKNIKKIVLVALAGSGERIGDHYSGYIQSSDKVCNSVHFENDLEWTKFLLQHVSEFKDVFFIFRPHPRDYTSRSHSLDSSTLFQYKSIAQNLPNNCAFNFRDDNISIYDFIPHIDLLLNSSSVTSYEFGLFGIRTLIYDPKLYYYHNDLVIYPNKFNDYIPLMKKTIYQNNYDKKKIVLNAFKYLSLRSNYEEIDISDVFNIDTQHFSFKILNRIQRYLNNNFLIRILYLFKNRKMKNIDEFYKVIKNNYLSNLDYKIEELKKNNQNIDDDFKLVREAILKQLLLCKKNTLYKFVKNKLSS